MPILYTAVVQRKRNEENKQRRDPDSQYNVNTVEVPTDT